MQKSGKIILGIITGVVAVVGARILINYLKERDYLYDDFDYDFEDDLDDDFEDDFEDSLDI